MSVISNDEFARTIQALEQFSELQKIDPALRGAKPLLKREGNALRLATEKEISFWDNLCNFFGCGSFQLPSVVSLLASDQFRKKLQETTTALSAKTQNTLENAFSSLDRKIDTYNRKRKATTTYRFLALSLPLPNWPKAQIVLPTKRLLHIIQQIPFQNEAKEYIALHNAPTGKALCPKESALFRKALAKFTNHPIAIEAINFLKKQNFDSGYFTDNYLVALKVLQANPKIPPLKKLAAYRELTKELCEAIEEIMASKMDLWLTELTESKSTFSEFEKKVAEFIASAQQEDAVTLESFHFETKWAPYLVQEMVQGMFPEADVGHGICWAISKRWSEKLRKYPALPLDELLKKMKFGKIMPKDCFRQAVYCIEREKDKPVWSAKNLKGKDAICHALQELIKNKKAVGHLSIQYETSRTQEGSLIHKVHGGHSIAIQADVSAMARVFDCNHGAFDFSTAENRQELFVDFLSDLILEHSEKINELILY